MHAIWLHDMHVFPIYCNYRVRQIKEFEVSYGDRSRHLKDSRYSRFGRGGYCRADYLGAGKVIDKGILMNYFWRSYRLGYHIHDQFWWT